MPLARAMRDWTVPSGIPEQARNLFVGKLFQEKQDERRPEALFNLSKKSQRRSRINLINQRRRNSLGGVSSSWSATCCAEFAQQPSARTWYRAHNASIVAAYLDHRELAESETHPERFFLNLILVRVLFAHALVAAPRLALSWLWPVGPVLGDPRLTITGIFVSLSRVMPDRYPLTRDLQWYIDNERGFGRILDLGMIQPRLGALYSWSAAELSIPELCTLVQDGVPAYCVGRRRRGAMEPGDRVGRCGQCGRRFLQNDGDRDDEPNLPCPCAATEPLRETVQWVAPRLNRWRCSAGPRGR